MSSFILQDLKSAESPVAGAWKVFQVRQDVQRALDVIEYSSLSVQVRTVGTAGAILYLQHAAVLEEDAFTRIASPSFDLSSATNFAEQFDDTLRWVRWEVEFTTPEDQVSFVVEGTGRER